MILRKENSVVYLHIFILFNILYNFKKKNDDLEIDKVL